MRRAVLVLLGLLGVALVGLLLLAPSYLGHPSAVSVTSLVTGTSFRGGSLAQTQRISQLEQEVERLKEALAQEQAAKGGKLAQDGSLVSVLSKGKEDTSVNIDLYKLLGLTKFFAGVSWDPLYCMPPYKNVWSDISEAMTKNITTKLAADLTAELAKIKGVKPEDIDPSKPYHEAFGGSDDSVYSTDPKFPLWRSRILPVMMKYMIRGDKAMVAQDHCKKLQGSGGTFRNHVLQPQDLGTQAVDCSDEMDDKAVTNAFGYYALPWESINSIAHGLGTIGTCTSQVRNYKDSYAQWLRTERVYNPDWMTFAVDTPEQDAVVLLFDVLYELLVVFTRQYWLGVITMQNPFDMYAIQDIIYTTKPDFLIETGTANGGSALLWASIFELSEMYNSSIVTMDMNPPKWEAGKVNWGGKAREDATKHKLWKKYVTFLLGSTTSDPIYQKVKAQASSKKKVMVLLDSHHSELHVTDEMARYCPLVSVGCYCIIEDTKMSRWASTGPLESVKKFLATHPEFEMDRGRELLYSHHAMGYLKRVR